MKKLVAVCMALVMALGLAACGGSGSSSSAPAASSGAVSAPAASGTSASEADDGIAMTGGNVEEHSVEAIKAKGVLVVTTEAGYAPFEFLDENDNVVGLDASLAQALADDLGVELDIQNIAFDSVVAEVQAGNADMAIAGLTPNADRKKSVDMSDMYYAGGQCMLERLIALPDVLGKGGKQLPGFGGLHPAGGAGAQRGAQFFFQCADLVAQGGLGEKQLPRGSRKIQCFIKSQKTADLTIVLRLIKDMSGA